MSVTVFDNFLPKDQFDLLDRQSGHMVTHGSWKTHKLWGDHLVLDSAPVLLGDLHSVHQEEINSSVAAAVGEKIGQFTQRTVLQHWYPGSYIPWHDDGVHHAALTLYLSDHKEDDGGWFMHEEDGEVKLVRPVPNRAVFVKGGTRHCVTAVNGHAPIRRTLQVWLKQMPTVEPNWQRMESDKARTKKFI